MNNYIILLIILAPFAIWKFWRETSKGKKIERLKARIEHLKLTNQFWDLHCAQGDLEDLERA